jgi:hypothetical protein
MLRHIEPFRRSQPRIALRAGPALSQGEAPKAAAKLNDHPKGERDCAVCVELVLPAP